VTVSSVRVGQILKVLCEFWRALRGCLGGRKSVLVAKNGCSDGFLGVAVVCSVMGLQKTLPKNYRERVFRDLWG